MVAGAAVTAHAGASAVSASQEAGRLGNILMAKESHHIATNKNWVAGEKWSEKFQTIFDKAGMSLDDKANKVLLPDHQGPHPDSYHQWIYEELDSATRGLDDEQQMREALTKSLNELADTLEQNPDWVNNPP